MDDSQRYVDALHAMQTGVKLDQAQRPDDGSPKHLRVGINSALCNDAALVRLLIAKGLITEQEYVKELADEMEREVARYAERLNLPGNVHLA